MPRYPFPLLPYQPCLYSPELVNPSRFTCNEVAVELIQVIQLEAKPGFVPPKEQLPPTPGQKVRSIMRADVMDGEYVWMVECAGGTCLLLKSPQSIFINRKSRSYNFDSDLAT